MMETIILNIVLILSAIVMTIGIISLIFLIVYLYRN
nr:MAG TPA: hypothetical protein [Caudoviricetes sp.]